MFSNLENFLNAESKQKDPLNETPVESQSVANDSWEFDIPDTYVPKTKLDLGADATDAAENVPRGQKMAARRLKKIGDTLAKGLVDTEKIEKRINTKKPARRSKTESPTKRGRGKRTNQPRYIDSDIDSLDSDPELGTPLIMTGRSPRRTPQRSPRRARRPAHDPNTIVLDCDDEFIGGPAVTFSRNLSGANAISSEDRQSLKVSVKVNNKIEKFDMNAFQKISMLKSQISEQKKVPADHIVLMFKDKTVSEHETPNSIGYIQGLVIKALISDKHSSKNTASSSADVNSKKLEIKIQAEGVKRPFITFINATDELSTLAFACAEHFKCDVEKVAIEFDGEFINFKETADDLGLEGGEVMDFFKRK